MVIYQLKLGNTSRITAPRISLVKTAYDGLQIIYVLNKINTHLIINSLTQCENPYNRYSTPNIWIRTLNRLGLRFVLLESSTSTLHILKTKQHLILSYQSTPHNFTYFLSKRFYFSNSFPNNVDECSFNGAYISFSFKSLFSPVLNRFISQL